MHVPKRMAQRWANRNMSAQPARGSQHRTAIDPSGFDPGPADLPPRRVDVPRSRREQAALRLLAVAYGHCPERIVRGIEPRILRAFEDPLERDEALAHVDLVLDVLDGRR